MLVTPSEILRAIDTPALIWAADGRVTAVNQALIDLCGMDPTGLPDWPIPEAANRMGMGDATDGHVCDLPLPRAGGVSGPVRFRISTIGGKGAACGTLAVCVHHVDAVAAATQAEVTATGGTLSEAQDAHEKMRQLSEMFKLTISMGTFGPFSFCPETNESWMVEETFSMMGYKAGDLDLTLQTRLDLIHPDDRDRTERKLRDLIAGRIDIYDNESRQRNADGSYHWYRSICRLVDRSEAGLPPIVSGITIEIDRLKENERRLAEALKEAETLNQRIAYIGDKAPTAIYEVHAHPDGRIEVPYFSANLPDFFGITAEEFRRDPESTRRHMPPEDIAKLDQQIERANGQLEKLELKVRVQHPVRGLTWLQIASHPYLQPDGKVISFASVTEISRQMAAEERANQAAQAALAANDRLNLIAENAPTGLYEFRMDRQGKTSVPYFNEKVAELLGVDAEAIVADANAVFTHMHPDDIPEMYAALQISLRHLVPFELQFRVLHPTRGTLWLLTRSIPQREKGVATLWHGSIFDLTDRLELQRRNAEAAKEVRQTHDRLRAIADAAPVGLFECVLDATGGVLFSYTSKQFHELTGLDGDGTGAGIEAVERIIHPDDLTRFREIRRTATQSSELSSHRFRILHPKQGIRWISASVLPSERDGKRVLTGVYIDITKDVEHEQDLRCAHELAERMRRRNEHQALHDPLTGLPNRRYFERVLNRRFADAGQDPGEPPIVLIRVDGDRFKYINDTFGHDAGDGVLRHIANIIGEETRDDCFPARIGGDEFSIIVSAGATEATAARIVERIRARLADPLLFQGRQCRIEASFGIASVSGQRESLADLLAFADAALYEAKSQGRNRMEVFTPHLRKALGETRRIAGELQDALARDEFEPFYQAQVDTRRRVLSGAEVLIRWRHPERGILPPGAFMHVAEQLRIMPDLDRLMLQKTHQDLALLRRRGIEVPKVSFNVSAGRMRDPDVVSTARHLIEDGVKVTFELLESALVEEADDVFKYNLDLLREEGVDIEIDDFGSGHASIVALMAIQPSTLKIDRRLIQEIAECRRARNLVQKILEIADTLEINTIAEGVETVEQVEVLSELGCHQVQGYYFSRPKSLSDFASLVVNPPWHDNGTAQVA